VKNFHFACGKCKDRGVLLARKLTEPGAGPYAFRCDCQRGVEDKRRFPLWGNPFHERNYERITLKNSEETTIDDLVARIPG
jgi:hypothetical protein